MEILELRQVLSADPTGFAVPEYVVVDNLVDASPLATSGPTGLTPQQIRHAYGFDQVSFNGIVGDGTGTTIAIVDAYDDPNIASDLHQFNLKFGLQDSGFTKVNQNGGTTMPAANKGWATEIALDVEWAHAIAPGANILLVEANSSSMSDLMTAVDYARRASGVVVVSMSWGGGEFGSETFYDSYFTTSAGHAGVSFFVSSGDDGAPVSYPAASPNVVSVGGTTLNLSGGNYVSETAWSGSGGGISSYENEPTYQKSIVTQSTTRRTNPDVSYDANPSTGFSVYDSYGSGTTTAPWSKIGGTSASAPQWAALVAIVDQGRALNGKSSLDGATQLLPAIYQLSTADFHDVTSGSSNGTPTYTAAAGYDLVTGRGSPIANLVIRDLVGSSTTTTAPTHYAVSAPASSTAGGTFSITVSALDASNNVVTNYAGKVHLSDTDVAAGVVLPADYTFTTADRGVHTFTGLKLVTAGTQTLTVRDTTNSSIVGSSSTTVAPAAVARLAFSVVPTGGTVGAPLSPGVTVQLFDAYNNLVTNDSSTVVTLSLGTNSGGGTLGGTVSASAVKGVATFSNLTLSAAGTYTLVAASGTLASTTSAAFTITAATTTTLRESFDGGTLSGYARSGGSSQTASITTTAAHDGTRGLSDTGSNDWIYRTDAAGQVKRGDTLSVWVKFSTLADGRAYLAFGAASTGTLALVAAPNTNQLLLQYVDFRSQTSAGGAFTQLAAVSQRWQAGQWYRLEVNWSTTGAIIGNLYAADGKTLLNAVQGTQLAGEPTITAGGFGFRSINTFATYWDSVSVSPSVNNFTLVVRHAGLDDGGAAGEANAGRWAYQTATLPWSPPVVAAMPSSPLLRVEPTLPATAPTFTLLVSASSTTDLRHGVGKSLAAGTAKTSPRLMDVVFSAGMLSGDRAAR